MENSPARDSEAALRSSPQRIGRVATIAGSRASVELDVSVTCAENPTVGKFMGLTAAHAVIIGLITEVSEQVASATNAASISRRTAWLDLIGEIDLDASGDKRFERGVTDYPNVGDGAIMLGEGDLRRVYGKSDADHHAPVGNLHQNANIGVHIDIDNLVTRHFAVLGTTGVGKSSGVTIILQQILATRPNLRIFLVDPHNEYTSCFGDMAQVLNPYNLRLPFWLFNFEEIVDVFFGGRPGNPEEMEILAEVIPIAKSVYLQYTSASERISIRRRDVRDGGFTADTPVPYRLEDLISLLDDRMGKLENRSSRVAYHKLLSRIQTYRKHPRYSFMFENANLGGDTMAEVLGHLFRLPPNGKPMTIMQIAGFPAEVVDSVVSVLCRMAFDFGLWSDGVTPLLFVCEEAHRYAPSDKAVGFGPTRRALSRVAKEGRKYGVYLGLVTQRPAEIDATIISQCSTLFVMRLTNDRDQSLIRSAVSDAVVNLLSFIPSLGTREVFTFGAGVALPTRMRFTELPLELRPNSEAVGDPRSNTSNTMNEDFINSVVERWRSASMSHHMSGEELEFSQALDAPSLQATPAPPLQPAPQPQPPSMQPVPRSQTSLRTSILKKPLDKLVNAPPPGQSENPQRFR